MESINLESDMILLFFETRRDNILLNTMSPALKPLCVPYLQPCFKCYRLHAIVKKDKTT